MRVLRGVAHLIGYQTVATFNSHNDQFQYSKISLSEQFRLAINSLHFVIDTESWWVCRHIKLSYDLEQNATNDETQFDMAVNPLSMNYFDKMLSYINIISYLCKSEVETSHCGISTQTLR